MNGALFRSLLHVEPGKQKRQSKEKATEIARERLEDVRRLRAEEVFRHTSAKRRAKSFILGALHEHH